MDPKLVKIVKETETRSLTVRKFEVDMMLRGQVKSLRGIKLFRSNNIVRVTVVMHGEREREREKERDRQTERQMNRQIDR